MKKGGEAIVMKKITPRNIVKTFTVFYISCTVMAAYIYISHPWLIHTTVGFLVIIAFFINLTTLIFIWQRVRKTPVTE